ncbi:MAG: LptF/LptG family permease [Treponemataceae bacterium]|nr:MAG: LptF/LptG family permease [Treponemataceae bacterium]
MIFVTYLFKRFVPLFFGAIMFFVMVLMLVDLLMNLWNYIQNEAPLSSVLQVLLYYVPKSLSFAVPLSILFASSYTLSMLYAQNELIAIFCSGKSLMSFTLPLLILSFLLSLALFGFEDRVVVPYYAKKVQLQNALTLKEREQKKDTLVVISDMSRIVYKADYFDGTSDVINGLLLIVRDEQRKLEAVIKSSTAYWSETKWVLSNPVQYTLNGTSFSPTILDSQILERLNEPPETFRNNTVSVEEVNVTEAKEYIRRLQRTGLPSAGAKAQYYKKFSYPFIVFIVVFLSIGLSGKTRKNVLMMSLVLCIGAAVLFYVSQLVTMLLAEVGAITPFFGAWFPVFFFVIAATVLMRYTRT